MSTTEILQAGIDKLKSFVYDPQPEILYPGVGEDPPDTGMWLVLKFFPNEPKDIAWDNDGCVDTRGFFRVLVFLRPGQGQLDPSELADALIAFFPKGLVLGSVRVRKRPWQSPMIVPDASKSYISVTIPYKGLT